MIDEELIYNYSEDSVDRLDQNKALDNEVYLNDLFEASFNLVMCFFWETPTGTRHFKKGYNLTKLHEFLQQFPNYPTSGSKKPKYAVALNSNDIEEIRREAIYTLVGPDRDNICQDTVDQWFCVLSFVDTWKEFLEECPDGRVSVYWYMEKGEY